MRFDVVDLKKFYYRTFLGRTVQKALRKCLCDMWGDTKGQTIVGFGFATPLLRPFLAKARRIIALMPAEQGVIAWPGDTGEHLANCAVLCEELHWPIANGQVDKLVLLHALETCTDTDALLDEIWRVLGPGGRVVFIVSNRSGLWARSDKTPFGVGRPYSVGQVEHLLRLHKFVPERHFPALYFAPSSRPFWLRMAVYWDYIAHRRIIPVVAGVIFVEASKQVYARPRDGVGERVRVRSPLGKLVVNCEL